MSARGPTSSASPRQARCRLQLHAIGGEIGREQGVAGGEGRFVAQVEQRQLPAQQQRAADFLRGDGGGHAQALHSWRAGASA